MTGYPPAGFRPLGSAPAAYITQTFHGTTDRTRVRVEVADDGPLARVHVRALTGTGELDLALSAEAAEVLAARLAAAADEARHYWQPVPVDAEAAS